MNQCTDDHHHMDPAALNEQGVSWLVLGGKQEAVTFFKTALVTMKASMHQIPEHHSAASPVSYPATMYASVVLPLNEERFYVYSRALVFTSEGSTSKRSYPLYSALILFNVAIAHHLRAYNGAERRAPQEAAYFYSVCLQILSAVAPFYHKSLMAPIQLAALNNLAVIHYEQGCARKAYSIMREVHDVMSPSCLSFDSDAFDQLDFDGMTLNAVMMKWTFAAPCA